MRKDSARNDTSACDASASTAASSSNMHGCVREGEKSDSESCAVSSNIPLGMSNSRTTSPFTEEAAVEADASQAEVLFLAESFLIMNSSSKGSLSVDNAF